VRPPAWAPARLGTHLPALIKAWTATGLCCTAISIAGAVIGLQTGSMVALAALAELAVLAVGLQVFGGIRLRSEVTELLRLAYSDELTGLANRRALLRALGKDVAAGGPAALILLDLDGFKMINDTHGHGAGDQVLCTVAGRLAGLIGSGGTVFRLGGDEFAVLLRREDPAGRPSLTVRLQFEVERPIAVGHAEVIVGASVGLAVPVGKGATPGRLLQRADTAMYRAKYAAGRPATDRPHPTFGRTRCQTTASTPSSAKGGNGEGWEW
jgi:diguanylate cyclase